jgi:hypothetical protein
MSLIYDALRKAEEDRKHQQPPSELDMEKKILEDLRSPRREQDGYGIKLALGAVGAGVAALAVFGAYSFFAGHERNTETVQTKIVETKQHIPPPPPTAQTVVVTPAPVPPSVKMPSGTATDHGSLPPSAPNVAVATASPVIVKMSPPSPKVISATPAKVAVVAKAVAPKVIAPTPAPRQTAPIELANVSTVTPTFVLPPAQEAVQEKGATSQKPPTAKMPSGTATDHGSLPPTAKMPAGKGEAVFGPPDDIETEDANSNRQIIPANRITSLSLDGIIFHSDPDKRMAILRLNDSGSEATIRIGDKVGAWVVKDIDPNLVTLSDHGKKKLLKLD